MEAGFCGEACCEYYAYFCLNIVSGAGPEIQDVVVLSQVLKRGWSASKIVMTKT